MQSFEEMPRSWTVRWWVRLLALLFMMALGVVAYGVIGTWLAAGVLPISFPDVWTTLLFAYVMLTICWVGITGKVPKFFAIGALKWPLFPPRR